MTIRTAEQEKILLEKAYARNPEDKKLISALKDDAELAKYADPNELKKEKRSLSMMGMVKKYLGLSEATSNDVTSQSSPNASRSNSGIKR